MARCGKLLLLGAACANAMRVEVETTGNSSVGLKPGNPCYDACGGKTGACAKCGPDETQLQKGDLANMFMAHVCCRARSNHGACPKGHHSYHDKYAGYQWRGDGQRECVSVQMPKSNFQVYPIDKVENFMPQPWKDPQYVDDSYVINFPEKLKGLIWMDQTGSYAWSDIPEKKSAPDAVVSFGDMREDWRLKGDTQQVDIFGPGWTWFNNEKAYHKIPELQQIEFHYQFKWKKAEGQTEDFTHADISMKINSVFTNPEVGAASKVATFQMWYQPSSEKCKDKLPDDAATWAKANGKDVNNEAHMKEYKQNVVAPCAKWKRPSWLAGAMNFNYYAFEIVDAAGNPTVYYPKYVEWVNKNSAPDVDAAINNGIIIPDLNQPNTFLLGDGVALK